MHAAAFDELERELAPQTTGREWIRERTPYVPNPANPNPFGMDSESFPGKIRRGVW